MNNKFYFCRVMGEKYRHEVLAHGGGKHPSELFEGWYFL